VTKVNQCYYCGKAIQDEDFVVKKVSLGEFRSERKPFHKECWREYHGMKVRKEALQYGALAVIAFLMVGALPIYYFVSKTLGVIVVAFSIAVLVFLAIKYYRIEK
jgi:hypothetical protein